MTKQDYLATQLKIEVICNSIAGLNLVDFINWISKAEALGPVLDPTLYREQAAEMEKIKIKAELLWEVKKGLIKH